MKRAAFRNQRPITHSVWPLTRPATSPIKGEDPLPLPNRGEVPERVSAPGVRGAPPCGAREGLFMGAAAPPLIGPAGHFSPFGEKQLRSFPLTGEVPRRGGRGETRSVPSQAAHHPLRLAANASSHLAHQGRGPWLNPKSELEAVMTM